MDGLLQKSKIDIFFKNYMKVKKKYFWTIILNDSWKRILT